MAEMIQDDAGGGVRILIKAVPGARRDQIVGRLGDRLKVRVAAPPEDGAANRAVCRLLASELGVKPGAVEIIAGLTHPEKTVRVSGVAASDLAGRWG